MILNIDEWLITIVYRYGLLAYVLFFTMVLLESGAVPMIFLPGDGFIFSLGVIAAEGALQIEILLPLLCLAAILGYWLNFFTGQYFGNQWLQQPGKKSWVQARHLEMTHRFFERYGQKAVALGRFVPIIRTVIPFLAGLGQMQKRSFSLFNVVGGIPWISLYLLGGYFLGAIPFVKHNFFLIYLSMIVLTTLPVAITSILTLRRRKWF